MVGITSYGACIPRLRLPLAAVAGGKPKPGGPEKAVANWDEDSVTLGVNAAVACLEGIDRSTVDGLIFASTTHAWAEKQAAAIVARALDLRRDILATDLGGSLRSGTTALRLAVDLVKAGSGRRVLVVAADTRLAPPRSALERNLGDGAVAFLVGEEDVAAALVAGHTLTDEIIDVWRVAGDRFVQTWEDRFVVDEGYRPAIVACVRGLLERASLRPGDVSRLVLQAPDARSHGSVVRSLGVESSNVQDPLFGKVGNTGTAFAPLLLAAALERAEPGERIVSAGYGDGADALLFEVASPVESLRSRRGVSWHLERRAELPDYEQFLRFRQLQVTGFDRRAGAGISATIHFRDRDEDLALAAQRCRGCGTTQYPKQRVCFGCQRKDDFDRVRLSDQEGKVLSFTFDMFAGSPAPPLIATVTDCLGARLWIQMTDATPGEVKLDLPVRFTFRRIHEAGGTPNYYWKVSPLR